jgi:hypothetical protein
MTPILARPCRTQALGEAFVKAKFRNDLPVAAPSPLAESRSWLLRHVCGGAMGKARRGRVAELPPSTAA